MRRSTEDMLIALWIIVLLFTVSICLSSNLMQHHHVLVGLNIVTLILLTQTLQNRMRL